MSVITFPCGPPHRHGLSPRPGTPDRAQHCQCRRPVMHQLHCIFCGRLAKDTIDDTWRRRAAAIAQRAA